MKKEWMEMDLADLALAITELALEMSRSREYGRMEELQAMKECLKQRKEGTVTLELTKDEKNEVVLILLETVTSYKDGLINEEGYKGLEDNINNRIALCKLLLCKISGFEWSDDAFV